MDQMVRERFLFWVDFSLELRVMRWKWAHVFSTVLSGFSFWLFWACWWRGSSWTRDTVPSSLSPLGVFACWLCLYSSCQHTGQRWVLPSVAEWLFLLPCRRRVVYLGTYLWWVLLRLWITFGLLNPICFGITRSASLHQLVGLWRLPDSSQVRTHFLLPLYSGGVEASLLGSGHAVLHWPFCHKNTSRSCSLPMAWRSSQGI